MTEKQLTIQLPQPLNTVLWANQPHPPFEAVLTDPDGVFDTSTLNGWKVAVALVDQNGRWFPLNEYPVHRGRAVISGIRFPLSANRAEARARIAICLSHAEQTGFKVSKYLSDNILVVAMKGQDQQNVARAANTVDKPYPQPTVPQISSTEDEALRNLPLAIRFSDSVETQWYADRHFPRFDVDVYRTDTGETVEAVNGWRIGLMVVDGHGNESLEVLHDHERFLNHPHILREGRVSVGGIRFSRVSSKCGGFFRLVVAVVKPGPFLMVVSENIQILSYRLYHAPKVALDKLGPNDSLSKMKGIGSLYAKRFAALGTVTISQLAALNLEGMTDAERHKLLDSLRKERGGLTVAKLQMYVDQAREIVRRSNPSQPVGPMHVGQPLQPIALANPQYQQIRQGRRDSLMSLGSFASYGERRSSIGSMGTVATMRRGSVDSHMSVHSAHSHESHSSHHSLGGNRRGSLDSHCSASPPASPTDQEAKMNLKPPIRQALSLKRALSNEMGAMGDDELFAEFASMNPKRVKLLS